MQLKKTELEEFVLVEVSTHKFAQISSPAESKFPAKI
jgi:hypothetical protein